MKTLMRTIMLICMLNIVITGIVLAQTSRSTTSTAPATTPEAIVPFSSLGEGRQLDDLLIRLVAARGEADISPVIPSGQISTEELLKINEDMNVMTKILANNLGQAGINILDGIGYTSFMTSSRLKPIQGLYLQGYGALFMANVDFLLSAPPDVNAQKDQVAKDDTDRVWEQTRQQIYEPQTATSSRRVPRATTGATEVRYDAQKVEKLKTTLIQSLKHASNIRAMKADESVILSITGISTSDGIVSMQILSNNRILVLENRNGNTVTNIYEGGLPDDIQFSAPTVFVIRAKKADIDAFAKIELNLEQFSQRVQLISYPLLSGRTNVASNVLPTTTTGRSSRTTTAGTSGTTTGGRTTTGTTGTANRSRTTTGTLGTTTGSGTSATPQEIPSQP